MDKERFEKLVEEALEEIPEEFKKILKDVTVIVEDKPGKDVYDQTGTSPQNLLLGVYHGVPYKHRGPYYGNLPPDVIVIFQRPIESLCTTEEEIRKKVREVVEHEIGHFFGLSERKLRQIERQKN